MQFAHGNNDLALVADLRILKGKENADKKTVKKRCIDDGTRVLCGLIPFLFAAIRQAWDIFTALYCVHVSIIW